MYISWYKFSRIIVSVSDTCVCTHTHTHTSHWALSWSSLLSLIIHTLPPHSHTCRLNSLLQLLAASHTSRDVTYWNSSGRERGDAFTQQTIRGVPHRQCISNISITLLWMTFCDTKYNLYALGHGLCDTISWFNSTIVVTVYWVILLWMYHECISISCWKTEPRLKTLGHLHSQWFSILLHLLSLWLETTLSFHHKKAYTRNAILSSWFIHNIMFWGTWSSGNTCTLTQTVLQDSLVTSLSLGLTLVGWTFRHTGNYSFVSSCTKLTPGSPSLGSCHVTFWAPWSSGKLPAKPAPFSADHVACYITITVQLSMRLIFTFTSISWSRQ